MLFEPRFKSLSVLAIEIAAVRHTTRNRKAPTLRLDGELFSGNDVPHNVGTTEVDVAVVAAIVRQIESGDCEVHEPSNESEMLTRLFIVGRILEDGFDWNPLPHDAELTTDGLPVVRQCAS